MSDMHREPPLEQQNRAQYTDDYTEQYELAPGTAAFITDLQRTVRLEVQAAAERVCGEPCARCGECSTCVCECKP